MGHWGQRRCERTLYVRVRYRDKRRGVDFVVGVIVRGAIYSIGLENIYFSVPICGVRSKHGMSKWRFRRCAHREVAGVIHRISNVLQLIGIICRSPIQPTKFARA